MKSSKLKKTIYQWRVRTGSLAAAAALILARPTFISIILGFLAAFLGLLLRSWACGHIQKEKKLSMSGPYQYTRNPLYLGNLIIGIGITVSSQSWVVLIIFVVYFLIFYPVIIDIENQRMKELFSSSYKKFEKVPLFIPTLKSKLSYNQKSFEWNLFLKNKEYRAFAGVLIFFTALLIKTLLN